MSAEQPLHAPVRLLVAENSENSAHELDSMLRDAGIATRLRVTDLSQAAADLPTADLMLCNAGLPRLEALLPQLRLKSPQVPIILVNRGPNPISTAEGLRLGAADVVSFDDREALVLVFRRELAHVCQSQRLREARRWLQEAEQRCKLLLKGSRAAIAYVHEGMHIHANPCYLRMFGFEDVDSLLGLPLIDLLSKDSAEALKQTLKRVRLEDAEQTLQFSGVATTGEPVSGTMTLEMAQYEGEPCLQVTVREAVREPSREAVREPSREAVREAVREPSREAVREPEVPAAAGVTAEVGGIETFLAGLDSVRDTEGTYRALLVAQIDQFPRLQRMIGLRAAEALGSRMYAVVKAHLENRPCTRLSSHQFAFAIAAGDRAHLLERVESLRRIAETSTAVADGHGASVTLSIGGAELEDVSDDAGVAVFEKALDEAFAAALRVEANGGGRLDVITREVARETPESEPGRLLAQINDAIDNQRFVLLFQPIISLRGEAEEHYEVFLRMLDRDERQIAPGEFLRTAVRCGVAAKIDRWVILQSIKLLSNHRAKGHNTRLTITLTANSVSDPEFPQWLSVAIKAARLPSDTVIFQVTEQDAAAHVRETRAFFLSLKAMHCRGCLSRFGNSSNGMELLQHLPVDYVKLDGSGVERLAEDPKRRDEVARTIRSLQDIGKLTVIPMVESAGMLSALWQAGANYIQGHYLQEPSSEMNFDFSND